MFKFKCHSFKASILTTMLFLLILAACGGGETPEKPETQPEETLAMPQEATAQPQTQVESGQASAEETEVASPAATSTGLFLFSAAQVPGDQESRDIFTIDTQGQNLRNLTNTPGQDIAPNWSPDGSQIIWVSDRDNNLEIYAMNLDGSNHRRLTQADGTDTSPTWSPDGQSIVFASERDGNWEIYLMEADGANPRNLSHNEAREASPSWSPDGTRLLFVSDRGGNRDIYVMNADGGNVIPLTDDLADDDDPRWSPDGAQIVFTSTRDGNEELYLMNADGSNLRRLTDDLPDDSGPVWSPDGQSIIWRSRRTSQAEIYVMDADGRNYRHLNYIPAEASTPRVQPQAAAQITFAGEPVELQTTYVDLDPFVVAINIIEDSTVYDDSQEYEGDAIEIILDPNHIRLPEGEQTDEDNYVIAEPEPVPVFGVLRSGQPDNPTLDFSTKAELPVGAVLNIFPGEIELIDTGDSPAFFLNLPDQPLAAVPDPTAALDSAPVVSTATSPVTLAAEVKITNGVEGFNGQNHFTGSIVEVAFDPTQVKFPSSNTNLDKFTITGPETIPIFQIYRTDDLFDDSDPYLITIRTEIEVPAGAILQIAPGEMELVQADGSLISGPFSVELVGTVPAEPAQGPALNAETYLMSALPKALEITVAVDQVTKMLRNPQADRLAWVAAMEPHANAAQAGYEALAALNPPAEFQQVHTTLLEGANACAQGTGQIVTGLKGPDQAALDASGPLIKTCTEKVIQAVQLIQQALTEQPAASAEGAEGNTAPASGDLPLYPILKDGKWGFINKVGQVVIEPQFTDVHRFQFPTFSEGLEPVNIGKGANAQWGYIDPTGQFVIEPQFAHAEQFAEGLARVKVGEKYGYIDTSGQLIIEPQFEAGSPFVQGAAWVKVGEKPTYIDTTGQFITNLQFDEAYAFAEDGLAEVRIGNQWGFIDTSGQLAIEPQFEHAYAFSEGLAPVKQGGKWGFIDTLGQMVIEPQFDNYGYFHEGLLPVGVGDKKGYIDRSGQLIIEPQFDVAYGFSERLGSVPFECC